MHENLTLTGQIQCAPTMVWISHQAVGPLCRPSFLYTLIMSSGAKWKCHTVGAVIRSTCTCLYPYQAGRDGWSETCLEIWAM